MPTDAEETAALERAEKLVQKLTKALREVAETVHYMEGSPVLDQAVQQIIDEALSN